MSGGHGRKPVEARRKQRSDRGSVRAQERDARALTWLAEMQGAPMDVVAELLREKPGQTAGQALKSSASVVDRWRRAGWVLLPRVDGGPRWVVPTRATVNRWLGWEMQRQWLPTVYRAAHTAAVGRVRLRLAGPGVDGSWVSERLLRHEMGLREHSPMSAHIPDAVWVKSDGARVLIEVELSAKSGADMVSALAALPDALRKFGAQRVLYFVADDAVRRNVERARDALVADPLTGGVGGVGDAVRRVLSPPVVLSGGWR